MGVPLISGLPKLLYFLSIVYKDVFIGSVFRVFTCIFGVFVGVLCDPSVFIIS